MSTDQNNSKELTEFHVVYVLKPYPRWEVQYGKRRMGYQAWDKRVAISAATKLAKAKSPSKVVVHHRSGPIQKEITFDA